MLLPFPDLIKKYDIHPIGILHIGSNEGQERNWYADSGIKNVIWIEADSEVFKRLLINTDGIPGTICINACIADYDDLEMLFHVASNEGQSSSLLEWGTHPKHHPEVTYTGIITVKTKRVDTIFKRASIDVSYFDFVNIDVQGYELHALKSMGNLLSEFRYVYVEVNEEQLYEGCPHKQEIYDYLAKFGFILREEIMTNFHWGDAWLSK
jgi:FkbM family methyltransferase